MLLGIQKNFDNENPIVGKLNDCGGNKAGYPSSAIQKRCCEAGKLLMRSKKTLFRQDSGMREQSTISFQNH